MLRWRQANSQAFKTRRSQMAAETAAGWGGGAVQVGIIMGSDSDLATMKAAAAVLADFGVPAEVTVVSAHRTPDRMLDYARSAADRGLKVPPLLAHTPPPPPSPWWAAASCCSSVSCNPFSCCTQAYCCLTYGFLLQHARKLAK